MPSRAAQSIPFAPALRAPRRPWLRSLAVLAFVALLHLLGGVWFARREVMPPSPNTPPLRVTLIPLAPVGDAPIKKPLPPRAAPRRHAKSPGHAVKALPRPPARPGPTPSPLPPTATGEQAALGGMPAATAPPSAGPPQSRQGGGTPFAPPPSADLEYDAFVNGVRNQTGMIRWHNDGRHYSLQVAIPLLFVGTFSY
ncbi:MAG: hypothetical protein KGL61_01900, partial [Burkholderiales bacterium]|nr:hypothetical protein [Burkholderiales bacterium]